jgi:hypothetical protein
MVAPFYVVDIELGGLLDVAGVEPIAAVLNWSPYLSQSDCISGPMRF